MTHEDDRLSEDLRNAARAYNEPPELTGAQLDEMWTSIEGTAFARGTSDGRQKRSGPRAFDVRMLLPLAAVLLVGVAIGRFALPRPETGLMVAAVQPPSTDSVAMPEPYQSTTSRYLGQAVALLVALPAEVPTGRAGEPYLGRAHDLLLTTRLLLDSPAAADPRFRTLLEDLELVLAQVVRLQSVEGPDELDLIRQALEQRDVLPRLRTAVADMSADD